VTLPIIYLLQRGGADADALIRGIVAERTVSKEQWRDIVRMLREQNAPELAYQKATEYATLAKSSLDVFPPSRERDALKALADYVLSRDR
jgi:octaprenyl-diphosphate synthase